MKYLILAVLINLLIINDSYAQVWPAEPAGSTVINDMPFQCVVCNGWSDYSQATGIVTDNTDPVSPPGVLRQVFGAGLKGGMGGGGGNAYNFGNLYPDVYFAYWFKVDSAFVNHPVGTKLSWIHTKANLGNNFFLLMEGAGPYVISAQYQNSNIDNSHLGGPTPVGSIRFAPNGGSFNKNQWILIEQYYKSATCPTCRNGIWKLRINSQLTVDITTMNTETSMDPGAVSFITIWGGVGSINQFDTYLYFAHAHTSIPNCGGGCPGTTPTDTPAGAPRAPINVIAN